MPIEGVNYTLLYSVAQSAQGQSALLVRAGVTSPQVGDLITALDHARQGNPATFENQPDLVAQACRLLETSSTFSSHPSATETLKALQPLAQRSIWARHAAGSSGIFGAVSAFAGRVPETGVGADALVAQYRSALSSPDRTRLHESIIGEALARGTTSERPTIIFTAGSMGAGKNTVMEALASAGYYEAEDFLLIDADEMKERIPEYKSLKKRDPANAASIVHEESGLVQEKLTWRALAMKKNILVQGTLRGTAYFSELIARLKREHPEYAVSIVHIDASEATALARARARAERTGRHVPEAYILDSKRAVEQSVLELRKLTDATIHISNDAQPRITALFKHGETVTVNLQVPVSNTGVMVNYQVDVPVAHLASEKSVGTSDQIKGNKRVIELRSGPHSVDLDQLQSQFLSKLESKEYWVVVRMDDPQRESLLKRAHALGFETIALGTAETTLQGLSEVPSYFVSHPNEDALEKMWKELVTNDVENSAGHYRLDFSKPAPLALAEQARALNQTRLASQKTLKEGLRARGFSVIEPKSLNNGFLGGRIPVLFSGASRKSWPLISEANQAEVIAGIRAALSMLDTAKVVLVTGATDYGVEKIVHDEAAKLGFTVLGTMVEHSTAGEVGKITHATLMANSWYGKALPVLEWIKRMKGMALFIGGGDILKNEIDMAKNVGVDFHLMIGPEGAANDKVPDFPKNSFRGREGLMATMYKRDPNMMQSSQRVSARELALQALRNELPSRGIQEVSYEQLVEFARGMRVCVLEGYSSLGYEHVEVVKAHLKNLMVSNGSNTLYVIGGTADGIGEAYSWIPRLAKALGLTNVKTAGIGSVNIVQHEIAKMDYLVLVDTPLGKYEVMRNAESLMVKIAQDTNGMLYAFKGGAVVQAEVTEALQKGVAVTINADPRIERRKENSARALIRDPRVILDGTRSFVNTSSQYSTLQVIGNPDSGPRPITAGYIEGGHSSGQADASDPQEFRAAVERYLAVKLGRRPSESELLFHLTEAGALPKSTVAKEKPAKVKAKRPPRGK